MTLAIILRLRILSLAVIFNYYDFSEGESNVWKIPLPAPFPSSSVAPA